MRGDLDFEQLVAGYQAALYRFALSLTRNENEASDLVQEAFYRWAAKGHQLVDKAKVKTWLFTALHREFLARRRRRVRFPHHELAEVECELPEVPPEVPARLDWDVLQACLGRMDPSFQAPVVLFYLQDHRYNEIAEILDVPLGTVKSRISRGIAQLQKMLSQEAVGKKRTDKEPS